MTTGRAGVMKKNGKIMRENFLKLLKTHVGKMSTYRSLAMLMKPKELKSLSGDVDENKGERRWTRNRERSEVARVKAYQLAVVALTVTKVSHWFDQTGNRLRGGPTLQATGLARSV